MAAQLTSAFRGTAPRTDKVPLPHQEPGTKWKFTTKPGGRLFIQKDAAHQAENAIRAAFPECDVVANTCSWHAGPKWFGDHKKLLVVSENYDAMHQDFQSFKNCPCADLAASLKLKFVEKWRSRGEARIVNDWYKFYKLHRLTRMEMNEDNPLRGGIPNDNNIVEGGNAEDKKFREHRRSKFINFMDEFGTYLEDVSMRDLAFIGSMKESVCSSAFFKSVYDDCIRPHALGKPSILSLKFSFVSISNGIPHGSFICLGTRFLTKEGICKENDSIQECLAKFGRHSKGLQFLRTYKRMHTHTQEFGARKSFDQQVLWHKTVHLLQPLKLAVVVKGVHTMLTNSGFPVIPLEQLLAIQDTQKCLLSCDCGVYQMQAWCKHVCAFALHRDIIQFPENKDPRPVAGLNARQVGAPRKRTQPLVIDP